MKYEIKGTPFPYVEVTLEPGEKVQCEAGGMSWMTANMKMETQGGGLGKMFSRAFTGESMFRNIYSPVNGTGSIAFASHIPGQILAVEIKPGVEIVAQKCSFLAATMGVDISIFFQKRMGAGFFGGEGFIMQKFTGNGIVFLEIDGALETKTLAAGESIVVDTGYLALCDASCSIDIKSVGSFKNALFGGEGIFNTVVTGPGRVSIQSMPAYQLASSLSLGSSSSSSSSD